MLFLLLYYSVTDKLCVLCLNIRAPSERAAALTTHRGYVEIYTGVALVS